MTEYVKKLADMEREHMLNMVNIKTYRGKEALDMQSQDIANFHRTVKVLRESTTINPITGRAKNMAVFERLCWDIVNIPCSPEPLIYAIRDIVEMAKTSGYPSRDRESIIRALNLVRSGHTNHYTENQLYHAVHILQSVKTA